MEGLPPELRRVRIKDLLERQSFVRVSELSRTFGISDVTVRSDLDHLEAAGSIKRVHGGAISATRGTRHELSFEESLDAEPVEKAAIAEYAASMVSTGDTVLLDVGSTTTSIAKALVARQDLERAVVITSGLTTALELEPAIPRITVVVTGGTLRPLQHSLVDPLADQIFDQIQADLAFVGCNGVDRSGGITNVNIPEAAIKQRMVQSSDKTVVVADGAKLGKISVSKICDLGAVDLILTGGSANPAVLDDLRDAGAVVEVAAPVGRVVVG